MYGDDGRDGGWREVIIPLAAQGPRTVAQDGPKYRKRNTNSTPFLFCFFQLTFCYQCKYKTEEAKGYPV